MKNILAIIVIASCALSAPAQTNALWLQTTVPPTNILTPQQIYKYIETESAKLDPNGQGLHILIPKGYDNFGTVEITFSPYPTSFFTMFEAATGVPDKSAKVFDKMGVIAWPQYRYVYTTFEGRCLDARTEEPITNFSVEGGSLCPPILAIQTNGYFVCGIQQRFDFALCPTATFANFNIMEGVKQSITFSAPGYIPLVITNEILPPGEATVGLRTYSIKLTRTNENQGEQAGPGCPPQGVGSPDP